MSNNNNSWRCHCRREANELKIELAAQRTEKVRTEVEEIVSNPSKMNFLAHLYVMWRHEFSDAPGKGHEAKRRNSALLALDWCLQTFGRKQWDVRPDTERIVNAEAPVDIPLEWAVAETDAKWANYKTLPQGTWRYVFFHKGKPIAGFDCRDTMEGFFFYLKARGVEPHTANSAHHLTKKEQAASKPNRYTTIKDGWHTCVHKVSDNGETSYPRSVLPPLVHPHLEESMAQRAVDFLNGLIEENEAYWAKVKEEKETK